MKKYFVISAVLLSAISQQAAAHAVAGDRVFPATLAVDDPGISDELTLPEVQYFKERQDDGSAAGSTSTSFEFDKRITENLGVSVSGAYIDQSHGAGNGNGFDNFSLGAKYVVLDNAPHELMFSVGVDSDIGGTGSKLIGAENYSAFTPTIYAGKGFGDLPDSLQYLKPFALTGQLGYSIPSSAKSDNTGEEHSNNLEYGFTVQYSIPYLQQHVKDVGIGAPFNKLVPLVEFQFEKPLDRVDEKHVTGTINPGFIWMGQDEQIGLEAVLPLNSESGSGVGVMAQVHFYLDDIFPTTIGRPIW